MDRINRRSSRPAIRRQTAARRRKAQRKRLKQVIITSVAVALSVVGLTVIVSPANNGPDVTGFSPRSGSMAGGEHITITGTGFDDSTSVSFGRRAAKIVTRTDSKIVVIVPSQKEGRSRLKVSDAEGTTRAGRYRVIAPPTIESVTPDDGKANTPTQVTIRGTDLGTRPKVSFGEVPALEIVRASKTSIVVKAPALDYGIYPLVVTTPYGSSADGDGGAVYQSGTAAQRRLKVGSFNVRVASGFAKQRISGERPWRERLPVVLDQLSRSKLDIIGIQEASASGRRTVTGQSQYMDVLKGLGSPYKITSTARGCGGGSGTRCGNGGSGADRILYNSSRLELLDHGTRKLDSRGTGNGSARYMGWAWFKDKRTGSKVFFVNTHLEPKNAAGTRARQSRLILDEIGRQNPKNLPTILVGDLAATKFSRRRNVAHTNFVNAGFVDPLVNSPGFRGTSDRVKKAINAQYSSLNDFDRTPQRKGGYAIGSYVDYILLRGGVRPHTWETVLNLTSSGQFRGVVPSDHNLITLSVALP